MSTSDDAQLALNLTMDRYADGDDGAFGDIYDLLAPQLLGFFMRQLRDAALAEDLIQQTFLHLHAARRNYVCGSNARAWAFAIGRRSERSSNSCRNRSGMHTTWFDTRGSPSPRQRR